MRPYVEADYWSGVQGLVPKTEGGRNSYEDVVNDPVAHMGSDDKPCPDELRRFHLDDGRRPDLDTGCQLNFDEGCRPTVADDCFSDHVNVASPERNDGRGADSIGSNGL